MSDQRWTWKTAGIALLILLAGLPLRWDLARRIYLEPDESMYFQAANEPTWTGTWEACKIHTHPPLAFLIYHPWLAFGKSEVLLRLPSIVFGAIATWIGYLWLVRKTDRRAALVAIFVLTFSMPVLHVESQMRSYSFLLTFVFGALWFNERFRETGSVRFVIGECLCLLLGLLTHYATAWVIGVLGVIGLIRALAWGLQSTGTRAWVVSQIALAGGCAWFYFHHVRGFVGGDVQQEFWASLGYAEAFDASVLGRLKVAVVSVLRFFGSIAGEFWLPMLAIVVVGSILFARRGSHSETKTESSWHERIEWLLLALAPIIFAGALHAFRVYPFGATRHSLWVMPFVVLSVAAAAQPLLKKPGRAWRVGVAAACLAWAFLYPYRRVTEFETKLTPELMQRMVSQFQSLVPREDLVLTDESARNVLSYYLGREEVDRGHDIGRGFREYHISGYRFVTIPKFHTSWYSLREDWESFSSCLGEQTTQPMWMIHMGFEIPVNDLKELGRRLPPATVISRHTFADNHLLRLKFSAPKSDTAQAQSQGLANPIEEGERS